MNRIRCLLCALWALGAGLNPQLRAQRPVVLGGERDEYLRLLSLSGRLRDEPIVFRSPSRLAWVHTDSAHPWERQIRVGSREPNPDRPLLAVLPLDLDFYYNSAFPRSVNDGVVWAGKGLTGSIAAGAEVRWKFISATFYPALYWSQNRTFELAPVPYSSRSQYAYPWNRFIDLPQRFGDGSFAKADWGQSGIRADLGAFTAGFSWENLWWGPAFRNPVLMSNAAGGFPHLDLGTRTALRGGIGEFEFRAIWGRLDESEYFDTIPGNGRRFLTGLVLGYRPSFLPGFSFGAARVLYQEWPSGGLRARHVFDFFGELFNEGRVLPGGGVFNDSTDQMLSVILEWKLPREDFAVYLEWARNDFAGKLRDFLVEPDHSRGYTAGFEKYFGDTVRGVRLRGEVTTLGSTKTSLLRASPTFYAHGFAIQGYTQRGQLLGAWIGPGGQSQFLGVDRYFPSGRWSVFFERVRYNDDFFFDQPVVAYAYEYHQVDLTFGFGASRFVGDGAVGGQLAVTRRLNRYFRRGEDETNLNLGLHFAWRRPELLR